MSLGRGCPCVHPRFVHARWLGVSEALDRGGKGLLHLASLKHKLEWKEHPNLLLKLRKGP